MHRRRPSAPFLLLVVALGCDGTIGESTAPIDTPAAAEYVPEAARLRRLTQEQYLISVEDALRPLIGDAELRLPSSLEPDRRAEGLVAIGATEGSVSPRGVEQYEDASYLLAEQLVAVWPDCGPASGEEPVVDNTCASESLRPLGRTLFRRPLTGQELRAAVRLSAQAAETLGDFRAGLAYGVASLLQSPSFLFRTESGEAVGEGRSLTRWELVTRLSFFLWNRPPTTELLDAASRGDLNNEAQYAALVDSMLGDERAIGGVRAVFSDMLELDKLDDLRKDRGTFVHMSPEVGPAAREETLRLVTWLYENDSDYRTIFTTRTTFIDRTLASIYGVAAPAREGFAMHEHAPDSQRAGILGHVSSLALHSHVAASSATLRGIFVRRNLLCGEIPPPPPDVDTSIPEPQPGALTLRDRVRRHLEEPSCASCHRQMDPLGLGLENFDALGRFRTLDNGARIDASGNVDGEVFRTPAEFGDVLAESETTLECAARTFFRVAHGRHEGAGEALVIEQLVDAFRQGDYSIRGLMRAVVVHPSFRTLPAEGQP
ncbi:MAG: DUF1588 domain-containing protein [Myxococcota bacterium]